MLKIALAIAATIGISASNFKGKYQMTQSSIQLQGGKNLPLIVCLIETHFS